MAAEYKTSYKAYSAWNYEKEIEDLNKASEQGWQLVKAGCFHSRFVKNPDILYRYQIDYGKIEDMGRYIETFREQGWEYVNSTFNGWHYFRKIYDPALPEEAYEIFTDRESLREMNGRWARLALAMGIIIGLFALFNLVQMIRMPELPRLALLLLFGIESAMLIRGGLIMRDPDTSRNRNGEGKLLAVFLAVMVIGLGSFFALSHNRLNMTTAQHAGSIDATITDSEWTSFEVKYKDYYYMDLDMKSDEPVTMKIINEAGDVVYTRTETDFSGRNIKLQLPKGKYKLLLSTQTGFDVKCEID